MSGATNCPETPRQKMIGMMYLVLTAMLALNVSAAILNGYVAVDDSLRATVEATNESNQESYMQFKMALEQNPEKTQAWYDKAMEVKQSSDAFYEYVQLFKDEMVAISEGKNAKKNASINDLKKKDDTNVPQQYAIEEKHADVLKEKIHAYREFMISTTGDSPVLDDELRSTFKTPRGTNTSGDSISWEESLFKEMPMCACLTVLTKLQNDIRNSEGRVVRYLLTQTDAGDLRVNKFNAYVIPSSKYVVKGTKYTAQVILAAVDSTQTPEYYVNGQKLNSDGIYEVVANSLGVQKLKVQVGYKDQQGVMQYLLDESEYTVTEPSATISNTDLNIVYRAYNNPFSVSVPGVGNDLVQLKCTHAQVTRQSDGSWIIVPSKTSPDKLKIEVYANMNGGLLSMGSQEFRVRDLPRANAYLSVNGELQEEPKVTLSRLKDPKTALVASYGPDGIVQAKFEIEKFTVKLPSGKQITVNGNKFNNAALTEIAKLKPGNMINVVSIEAKGENGAMQTLRSLTIELR